MGFQYRWKSSNLSITPAGGRVKFDIKNTVDYPRLDRYNYSMTQNDLLLVRGLAALDIPYSGTMVHRLITYTHELERWNPVYGLVKAEGEDLIVKHILDSLAPWRLLVDLLEECDVRMGSGGNAVVSDIGTGAGLPGIPLSIVLADRQFRLIDRMGKRITFLENQKALLQLENVSIEESEIERAAGRHQVVTFRAFRPFSETKLFKAVWKALAPGGAFFAYKGKMLNAKIELAELGEDKFFAEAVAKAAILPVWVPFLEEERCVVILRKTL